MVEVPTNATIDAEAFQSLADSLRTWAPGIIGSGGDELELSMAISMLVGLRAGINAQSEQAYRLEKVRYAPQALRDSRMLSIPRQFPSSLHRVRF